MDLQSPNNYRPFSTRFCQNYSIRSLIKTAQLSINSLLDPFQSGFQFWQSTETALTREVNNLLIAVDSDLSSLLMILDLSAAFDTIDRGIRLSRLEQHIGIQGWFHLFLSYRPKRVGFNNTTSDSCVIKFCAPLEHPLWMMSPRGHHHPQYNINFHTAICTGKAEWPLPNPKFRIMSSRN